MTTIYACTNTEIICDGHDIDIGYRDQAADKATEDACRQLQAAIGNDHDVECVSTHSDWQGGRFYGLLPAQQQIYKRLGHFAVDKDETTEAIEAAIWAACDTIDGVLAEYEELSATPGDVV